MKAIALELGPTLSRKRVLMPGLSLENVLSPCEAKLTEVGNIQTLKGSFFIH